MHPIDALIILALVAAPFIADHIKESKPWQ